MYISLYRKYRPQKFSDIVGQGAAVGVLLESLRKGSIGHAYLFSGPRGCGKTTAARLVAKSLDCLNRGDDCEPCGECENCRAIAAGDHLDVVEIDGASNRGIENIRDLKTHVSLKALSGAYKVYIIDEVHMLTDQAFNALLKTIEEPPANVIFIMATTEPSKVPVTIRSRCQHIPFHRISLGDIVRRIKDVCAMESIPADEDALWEIGRQADGALRDALSLSEQAIALGRGALTSESVDELTGGSSRSELEKWLSQFRTEPQRAAVTLHEIMSRGVSPERLCESLFLLMRDLWLFSLWGEKAFEALETSESEREFIVAESKYWDKDKLQAACRMLNALMPRTHFGMKSDIFGGLIFIELQNIKEGKIAPAQFEGSERAVNRIPPRTNAPSDYARRAPAEPAYGNAAELQRAPAAPAFARPFEGSGVSPAAHDNTQKETQRRTPGSFISEAPIFSDNAPDSGDPAALCAKLGEGEFADIIKNLASNRLSIAAALLNAKLSLKEGVLDVEFERPMPAKNYLSQPRIRGTLQNALSKLGFGGDPKSEERTPESKDDSEPQLSLRQPDPAADGQPEPAPRQPASPAAQPRAAASSSQTPTSNLLRKMGAEVLYIKNAETDEEETEAAE
ncbi:MAG: DNA polymerase III subunit gamma/tau [Synergistes sp.]|nr:DNA polymerase III subunit gamma/tau [Synergistes sp.]